MPAPDVYLDEDEAPSTDVDLGANPICSNCGEDLTGPGGVLCRSCFQAIYEGCSTSVDALSGAELEELIENAKPWNTWYYYPSTTRDTSLP